MFNTFIAANTVFAACIIANSISSKYQLNSIFLHFEAFYISFLTIFLLLYSFYYNLFFLVFFFILFLIIVFELIIVSLYSINYRVSSI